MTTGQENELRTPIPRIETMTSATMIIEAVTAARARPRASANARLPIVGESSTSGRNSQAIT